MSALVSCVATSLQLGSRRYPTPSDRPRLDSWRCELTALSHTYNIYFVASSDSILVFRLLFPTQAIAEEPDLTLHPPISSANLGYHIDPETPHSINRLHVDFLGREEILLVACDDGDVIGYHVSALERELERLSSSMEDESTPLPHEEPRAFFHRNVGKSAWGLAVHREARLIAISANTHKVTVVAFALSDPNAKASGVSSSKSSFTPSNASHISSRKKERTITLQGANNIPSVSFNNTGTDPTGKFLYSCSIDGQTQLWNLQEHSTPVNVIHIGRCVGVADPAKPPTVCLCPDSRTVPHATWSALFLDPRSCHHCSSIQEAFGEQPVETDQIFWDISHLKNPRGTRTTWAECEESSEAGSSGDETEDMSLGGSDDDEHGQTDIDDLEQIGPVSSGYEESDDSNSENTAEDDSSDEEGGNEENIEPNEQASQHEVAQSTGVAIHNETQSAVASLNQALFAAATQQPFLQPNFLTESSTVMGSDLIMNPNAGVNWFPTDLDDSDMDDDDVEMFDAPPAVHPSIAYNWSGRALPNKKYYYQSEKKIQPSTPTVIVTKEEIYLIQNTSIAPVVVIHNPLHPLGPANETPYASIDRLNYSLDIPELGIFIVASPNRRVGIFALTQTQKRTTRKDVSGSKKGDTLPMYGLRHEYTLPTTEQESKIPRFARLVGIAAAPLQGMLKGDTTKSSSKSDEEVTINGVEAERKNSARRRWRLAVLYNDFTVLTYELARADGVNGLGVLAV